MGFSKETSFIPLFLLGSSPELSLLPHFLQWEWNKKLIFAARKALQWFQHVFLHCSAFKQSQHNGKGLCKLHSGNCWISYKQEHIPVTCKHLLNQHTFFFLSKKTEGPIFFLIKVLIVCSSSQQYFQIHEHFSVTAVTANSLIQFHFT